MKKTCILCACLALAGFVSCQKQQTEEERKAEIDRQVEQRLAVERQAQEKEQLEQQAAELDAREKDLADQQAAANSTTPRVTRDEDSGYSIFYTRLEPYGDWRETRDYGYVWQPRGAQGSRNWHPYTQGRWAYTEAGWTWISEEPFGWATYHYGRWARLRTVGWVWVPGNEWAPAWVSWRKGDDYVGWAPLPPEARFERGRGIHNWSDNYYDVGPDQYRFVSAQDFGAQQIERSVVPRERNVTIINQTINVTNITYSNTTVINQGPSYEDLRSRSRQPIERLRLEREVNINLNVGAPRSVVRGEVVAMPAPFIAVGQPVERPRHAKEAITQTAIDHGWEDAGDRQATEKARTKMKSEATPPADAPSKTFVKPAIAASDVTATATPVATAQNRPPEAPATAAPTAAVTGSSSPSASPSATRPQGARPSATPSSSPSPTATSSPSPEATTPAAAPQRAVAETPEPEVTIAPSRKRALPLITPPPRSASPDASAKTDGKNPEESPQAGRGRHKSYAQQFDPGKVVPMPKSGSSPADAGAASSSEEKLEEKKAKNDKHAHGEAKRPQPEESVSPTPTPTLTPEEK